MGAMMRCALLALAALGMGCNLVIQPPKPPEPPVDPPAEKPKPPSEMCVGEGKCGCSVEVSEGVFKHICCAPWISGGILVADLPTECPSAPVTPPAPAAYCITPGEEYILQPRTPAPYNNAVNAAIKAVVGDRCDVGNSCDLGGVAPQDFLEMVIAELGKAGLCAGRQVAGGDKIAIGERADNWTHHVVNFGGPRVVWQPSASEPADHWRLSSQPLGPCPQVTRIDLAVKQYAQRSLDATPKTTGLENCTALGFTDRRECPLGVEGTDQRRACEDAAGPYTWTLDGVPCSAPSCWPLGNPPNPLLYATPAPGRVTVCAGNGFCSSVVLP